jgi:streptogramin lyase
VFVGVLLLAFAASSGVASASPTITEFSTGLTSWSGPADIASGPDGNLWFSEDSNPGGIAYVTPAGAFTEHWTGITSNSLPWGIVAGPDGNLWFTEQTGKIGRITTTGTYMEFSSGISGGSQPFGIAAGPDNNLWFTETTSAAIGRISPTSPFTVNEFPTTTSNSQPRGITAGPDGNLWFTESANPARIGRITPTGTITEFSTGLTANTAPNEITAGPDGNLWFTESNNPGAIGRITPSGTITEFTAGLTANSQPTGITQGYDGNLWFTEKASPGRIGRITPSGVITEYTTGLSSNSSPLGITAGPDGNVWFTENASPARIGMITVGPGVASTNASGVDDQSATLGAAVRPNSQATTYSFEYGTTTAYGTQTLSASAGSSATSQPASALISGLAAGTTYHFRVVATNASDVTTGPDQTFTTTGTSGGTTGGGTTGGDGSTGGSQPGTGSSTGPLVPTPPSGASPTAGSLPPVLGSTVAAGVVSGQVLVKLKGSSRFVPLTSATLVPVGSIFDTRNGTVELRSARDKRGRTQSGTFWGEKFEVRQSRTGGGLTDIVLRGERPKRCGRSPARRRLRVASAARSKGLWGKDKKGHFRTRGRYGSAAVRGTKWLTLERCDGTFFRVAEGAVIVRDQRRHRNIVLKAGKSYLARAPR